MKKYAMGSILGALVGDAAGATLEFMGRKPTPEDADNALKMVGGGVWRVAPGQVTDDGELTLALCHALAGSEHYPVHTAAQSYRRWMLSNPFDVGNATRAALGHVDLNSPTLPDDMAMAALRANLQSKANGALMRATPLGVWATRVDVPTATAAAKADTSLTHPNWSCQWSTAAYGVAIRHLLLQPGDAAGAFEQARAVLQEPQAAEVLGWLQDAESESLPPFHPEAGFVRIGFTHAFAHLKRQTPYVEALRQTLLGGGDTDTNACIVGGLLGALHGTGGIPLDAQNKVLACDTSRGRPRPEWLRASVLPGLVDDLVAREST